ncbi:unnamed protein product [Fusarium equiseti]|uniref:Uncharacterized protein n=1 Tax=Fusarium equiseti TaxID=61235 RepID=A0A8J2NK33_FUSEQ|nr:unnamed protein product [Fusarium equiseti]
MTTMVQSMADTGSVAPGSAEFMFTVLQGRGLGCGHFPRYSTKDTKQPDVQFPSRLGFFQGTESQPRISILDTEKLCLSCLRQVVPNGYNFWSVLTGGPGNDLGSTHLQAPSLLGNYPPFVQAGTEKFPEPVILPIPDVPHAKDVWEWLKNEQKPFFLDHLHLTKRLTVSVKRAAERDFNIASAHGISFYQREIPGRSGLKNTIGSSTGRRTVRRKASSSRTPDTVLQTTGEDITGSLHGMVTQPQAADTPKSSSNVNASANVSLGSLSRSKKRASPRVKGSRNSSVNSIQSITASIEKTVQRPETKAEPAPTPPFDMCSPSTGNMPRLGEDILHESPVQNVTSFEESTGKKSSPHPKVDDKSTPAVGFDSVTLAAEILSKKSKPAPTTAPSLRTKNWSRHTLNGFERPPKSPKVGHEASKGSSGSTKEQKTGRSKNPKKSDVVKQPKSRKHKDSESKQSVKPDTEKNSVANTRSAGGLSNAIESGLQSREKPKHQPKSAKGFPGPIASRGMAHKPKQQKEKLPLSNNRQHGQKNASDSRFGLGRGPSDHYPRAKHNHSNHFGKMNGRGNGHNDHNFQAGRSHTSGRFLQKPGGQPPSVSHIHIHREGSKVASNPSHGSSFSQPDIYVVNPDYMDSPSVTQLGPNSDEESRSSEDSPSSGHHSLNEPPDSDSESDSKPDSDDTDIEEASASDHDMDEVNAGNSSSEGDEVASDSGKSESAGHSTDAEMDREDLESSSDDDQHSQSASSRSDDQTSDQDHESSSGDDDQNSDIDTQSQSSDQDNESSDRSLSEMDDQSYETSGDDDQNSDIDTKSESSDQDNESSDRSLSEMDDRSCETSGDDESDRHSLSDRYDSDGSS